MAKLLPGLEIGDELVDGLPDAAVSPCRKFGLQQPERFNAQLPEPDWVDWTLVRRGQALWCQHLGRAIAALTAALLQGFTIARFAEVLFFAGYAQSPRTSMSRYQSTAFFIMDWFRFPLDDPSSVARQGIYTVRCMHSYSRRRSGHLFSRETGEGIPLSQYDLGEVLLGFSAVCLMVLEKEILLRPLAPEDREAMVHTWRVIGWHLGIKDEFNVCSSASDLAAYFDDYMLWTPQRLNSCRECTHALQQSAVAGFGKHTGIGERYWEGFLGMAQIMGGQNIEYVRCKPLFGMTTICQSRLKILGSSNVLNAITSRLVFAMRDFFRSKPGIANLVQKHFLPLFGAWHDIVVWRVLSLIFRVVAHYRRPSMPLLNT